MRKPRRIKNLGLEDIQVPSGEDPIAHYLKLAQDPATAKELKARVKKVYQGDWKTLEERKQPLFTPQELAERDEVIRRGLEGLSVRQIELETAIPFQTVKKYLMSAEFQRAITEQRKELNELLLESKIPTLKNIVALSLNSIQDYLMKLQDPEEKEKLTSKQAKDLACIAKDLNELLRLELGQSTQNVQIVQFSLEQTRHIFEDLRAIDPVMEYPDLPPAPTEAKEDVLDNVIPES